MNIKNTSTCLARGTSTGKVVAGYNRPMLIESRMGLRCITEVGSQEHIGRKGGERDSPRDPETFACVGMNE